MKSLVNNLTWLLTMDAYLGTNIIDNTLLGWDGFAKQKRGHKLGPSNLILMY